jgi:outer membrane receptor protein involved in Fe transport
MLRTTGVMIALSVASLAKAEAPAKGAGADTVTQLGEIIVTAEKRDATVQKTPISITALKGTDLVQAGVTNLTTVAEQVPGISLKTGGPGQTEFEMRGLNSAGGNSPTVGFYLDDTSLTTFAYATAGKVVIDPDLYDLNRVEVLRGPQGTLYGSVAAPR